MKTFSIFCIGTGHDSKEEFNILTVLHRLTEAVDVDNNGGTHVQKVSQPNAEHHKILYDGPPDLPDILAFKAAATRMIQVRDNAIKLIQSVNLPSGRSGREAKITVNLVGHSRGAVNCLMIASELDKQFGSRDCHCNLFLIDPVKVTDTLSVLPKGRVPETDTRFIFDNVKKVVQIVMEDDVKFLNVVGIFKLYKIEEERVRPAPDGSQRITNIRLPGTHGTATQCNPLITSVEANGLVIPPEKIWPIGGVALSTILQYLQDWGTPLHQDARDHLDPARKFYLYNRIQIVNTIVEDQAQKRIINNVKLSTSGQNQERNIVPGPDNHTYRSDELLDKFGENPFRFHPVFINPHHVQLCIDAFGTGGVELVDIILAEFNIAGSERDLKKAAESQPADSESSVEDIFEAVKRNILLFPDFFSLLKTNGFTWDKQQLDWRLAAS